MLVDTQHVLSAVLIVRKRSKIVPDGSTAEGGGPASPPLFWLMIFRSCWAEKGNCSSGGRKSYANSVERSRGEMRNWCSRTKMEDSWSLPFTNNHKCLLLYAVVENNISLFYLQTFIFCFHHTWFHNNVTSHLLYARKFWTLQNRFQNFTQPMLHVCR